MRSRLILWSITAALAGFLFGFDTVVISGAEEQIQDLWRLSGKTHGLAISMALWGTVLGAIFGGIPTARFGRRKTLISVGFLYFVSAVLSALAPEVYSFMIARFIGGLGVGASTVAAPMFISEISPAQSRGKLAGMFQFNIVFGILVAFVSNYLIAGWFEVSVAWRWMLGVEAFPALLYTVSSFLLPESPRWLITHAGKREAGAAIFRQIYPEADEKKIDALVAEVEASVGKDKKRPRFLTSRLQVPILLAFLIAFFNQLSGINIILYFAPRLLGLAGLENALLASAALGVTNLIFTFVGLWLIDKLGRRSLLTIGSLGYIVSLGICAYAFLSTPAFKVVSAAGDMESQAAKMAVMEEGKKFLTEADKGRIRKGFSSARTELLEASATIDDYSGKKILHEDVTPAAAAAAAREIKAKAAGMTGVMSMVVLVCLVGFIAAHAIGQGTVIWVFISEIFPNQHRAAGQALGSSTHWVCAAGLTFLFPIAMAHFEPGELFGFFCFMMCLQLVWVIFMVPETKGFTLEDIERKLLRKATDGEEAFSSSGPATDSRSPGEQEHEK